MTTIDDRVYAADFGGLKSTAITAGVVLVAGFTGQEILKRLRRYPEEDARRARGEKVRDRGVEEWAMGYLYRARSFVPFNPTPDFSTRPLAWIWTTSYKLSEKFYETHCGPDATVYLRFLRGTFFWTALITCTVFPTLLSINWLESSDEISTNSIERASLSSLIKSPNGVRLLWVHVICIWFLTFTWFGTLFWVALGAVRIRRNVVRALLEDEVERHQEEKVLPPREPAPVDARDERPVGWRFRTVLMRNIGPAMRSEEAISEYFHRHLRNGDPKISHSSSLSPPSASADDPYGNTKDSETKQHPLISDVIIVRKQSELNELYNKYRAVLYELESAHCALAENVIRFVQAKVNEEERVKLGIAPKRRPFVRLARILGRKEEDVSEDVERLAREGDSRLVAALRGFLPGASSPPQDVNGQPTSLWTVLHSLNSADPTTLDRFQPLFKLRHFRGQRIPSIDYHLAKLNLLAVLISDQRAHPEAFEAAPSAFITFERAADARRARKELKWRPGGKVYAGKILECKIKRAPEVRDLDWNRLVYVSLSADILRGALLQFFIWVCTIIWVLPLSLLVGLLSLSSISKYIPNLAKFLESNTTTNTLFSSLLPTSIVALLGMLVPTLIGIVTRNGQALITVSKLHALVMSRYWAWLVVNILVVFCVGMSAFTAVLDAFKEPGSVLKVIASAFSKGATFFVSWTLLVVGLHHGIEICLLGIPYINHATIRKLKAPRKREFEALPRSFNYAYWAPNHLLVFAVSAIFALLNPVTIAFNMFYQFFVLLVFKNQFAHVYWRRWYEGNGRFIFRRLYRYSLDAFLIAQIVAIALLWVNKKFSLGGACIPLMPITLFTKLIGTRWFDHLMDEIDELEIDLVCSEGEDELDLSVPLTEGDPDLHRLKPGEMATTVKSFLVTTLPALALRPQAPLPAVPSPHKTSTHLRPRSSSRATNGGGGGSKILHPRSRSNSARPKVRSSGDDDRPMLGPIRSNDSHASSHELHDMSGAGMRVSPVLSQSDSIGGRLDLFAFSKGEVPEAATPPSSALITTHPPIVRDDRPVTNVRYDNPAQVAELARALWLPRDPLVPCDLGDTVDYHGRLLVSSEGGQGIIGSWDECITEVEQEGEAGKEKRRESRQQTSEDLLMPRSSNGEATFLERRPSRLSLTSGATGLRRKPTGTERIRVAGDVAAKIEAEEGVRVGAGRRRGSSAASGTPPPPGLGRRGTGTSTLDGSAGPRSPSLGQGVDLVAGGTPPSPVFLRHPTKSSPRIPTFTDEPETLALPSTATSSIASPPAVTETAYPFPPPSQAPTSPHSTLRRRPSFLEADGSQREQLPLSPGASSLSPSHSMTPRSPSINRTHRGRGRSASAAISMHPPPSIAEGLEVAEEVFISQSEALRNELLEEEREEHQKRVAKEEARKRREERQGGWLGRLVVGRGGEEGEL